MACLHFVSKCRVGKSYEEGATDLDGEGATEVKKGSRERVALAECRVGKNYPGRQGRCDRLLNGKARALNLGKIPGKVRPS